jgi:hypothetical protein
MEVRKNEYWVANMRMTVNTRPFKTVVNIYRIDKENDVAFLMCGDEDIYWRSQFCEFEFVRKVEV